MTRKMGPLAMVMANSIFDKEVRRGAIKLCEKDKKDFNSISTEDRERYLKEAAKAFRDSIRRVEL